jgi:hypothetical protein
LGINGKNLIQRLPQFKRVEGKIIRSKFSPNFLKLSSRGNQTWHIEFRYEYRVRDKIYRNGQISIKYGSTNFKYKSDAEKFVNDFFEGRSCNVYYDSDKPSFSVLKPGEHEYENLLLFIGYALLAPVSVIAIYQLVQI